jgi:Tfp pilus assembly protein PilO
MEANNKNQSLITIGLLMAFVILLGFYMFKVKPSNENITVQKDELVRLHNQTELISKKMAEKQASAAESSQDTVQAALPLWDNSEQLLLDLNRISESTGVVLRGATFSTSDSNQLQTYIGGQASPFPSVHELLTAVVLEGKYDAIMKWFEQLQKLDRLTVINSFNLDQSTSALQKTIIVNLSFTAYFDPSYRSLIDHEVLPYND